VDAILCELRDDPFELWQGHKKIPLNRISKAKGILSAQCHASISNRNINYWQAQCLFWPLFFKAKRTASAHLPRRVARCPLHRR
jgi:hypothetical protein